MTTGMIDFMMSSGLMTDMAAIPVPLFAVPYAAPKAEREKNALDIPKYCSLVKEIVLEQLSQHKEELCKTNMVT